MKKSRTFFLYYLFVPVVGEGLNKNRLRLIAKYNKYIIFKILIIALD